MRHIKKFNEGLHWGSMAGGVLPLCVATNRFLVNKRSKDVFSGGTWDGFGGKLDIDEGVNETIPQAVRRELFEETKYRGKIILIPGFVFKDNKGISASTGRSGGFEYHNHLGLVPEEFKPVLNWESEDAKWMTWDELIALPNKHHGLVDFIRESNELLQKYLNVEINKAA